MDIKNDLWNGGPWEQPIPVYPPPPTVVIPTPRPSVLRPKRRRKWPWFAGLSALLLVCVLGVVLLNHQVDLENLSGIQPPTSDSSRVQEEEYSTDPPSIPRAAADADVTVTLMSAGDTPLTYREIYEKTAPSMVSIESESRHEYSTGTGIILSEDGYIITNAHVVAGAQSVQVSLQNNRVLTASLVGFDADEDLAVLKVDAEGLTPAEFGDSFELQCGDPVAALGDPLGYRCTITDGIVSALDREVEVDDVTMVLIQTSAAINFGNSGGALINQYGQIVGITTIKIVTDDGSAEGLGFAIPSRRVKYVADNLIAGREVHSGVFGFSVNRFPVEGGGLEIVSVDEKSDAWTQGIRPGDILLAADGMDITGTQDLIRLKQCLGAGDAVELTYLRDGEIVTVPVTLVDTNLIS